MINDWWDDFLAAGAAVTSELFGLLVTFGIAASLFVLVLGVVLFFTRANDRWGKSLIINGVAAMVLLCGFYMIAFATDALPDLSGIFVLPGTSP